MTNQQIAQFRSLLEEAYTKLDIANGIVDPYDPDDMDKDGEVDLSFCGPLCRRIRAALDAGN